MTTKNRRINWAGFDPKQPLDDAVVDAALKVNPEAVDRRVAEAAKARKQAKKHPTKKKATGS